MVGCAGWRWRIVFALLPHHCQGWSSCWWHVSAGAPVLFIWFGINVRAGRNPCRCKMTAMPVGAVTSLEAWSRPFSFCPLPSYGGNPRSSLLDRATAASRRRCPPWRHCLCCSWSPMLTTGVDVGYYLKHGPRGRNVHWSGISGCCLSQVRPGPAASLADYSFLGAMGGRYVDACHLRLEVVLWCCLLPAVTRSCGSMFSLLAILGERLNKASPCQVLVWVFGVSRKALRVCLYGF
jgi:hypothetical protein